MSILSHWLTEPRLASNLLCSHEYLHLLGLRGKQHLARVCLLLSKAGVKLAVDRIAFSCSQGRRRRKDHHVQQEHSVPPRPTCTD